MALVDTAMRYFPYVVHPTTVLGVGILALIHHEWARQPAGTASLWRRIAAFLAAGMAALAPTAAYFLLLGANPMEATEGNSLLMDGLVASGLFIVSAITWYLWRRFEWGPLVPGAMEALAAVTVPYIGLSPFWNVSGHVILALMPMLYLTLVDRKFWPLLVLPVVMIPNRVYLEAHTWAQSVGGFLIAAVIVVGVYRRRFSTSHASDLDLAAD